MAFIPMIGGGSGGSDSSNIKYDPTTDKIYLYDGSAWQEWRYGGLQTVWLYENGTDYTEVTGGWTMINPNTSSSIVSMNDNGTIKIAMNKPSSIPYVRTNNLIDAKGHNKFHVSYSASSPGSTTTQLQLCNSTGTVLYYQAITAASSGVSGAWDVGVSLNELVYLKVIRTGGDNYLTTLNLSDIRFYSV